MKDRQGDCEAAVTLFFFAAVVWSSGLRDRDSAKKLEKRRT
jgi:hypothetical protein